MAEELPVLPWWDDGDTSASMLAAIDAAAQRLQPRADAMRMFSKRSMLTFVFMANKLERTLPTRVDDVQTYSMLEAELNSSEDSTVQLEEPPASIWPAEGGSDPSTARRQLLQFVRAAKYLCWPPRELTVDTICTAHKLMMWGAADDGVLLAAGQLRTTSAHSGTGFICPDIPARLQQIVADFNTQLSSHTVPSYRLAADLLYQFVTLHPFQNGNGRMCRLLAAYAAMRAGLPFMLHLSNGHSKTRKHYMQVLRYADKHECNTSRLQSYLLECMHGQWQNALAYAGALARDC
jgi:Fic family protein